MVARTSESSEDSDCLDSKRRGLRKGYRTSVSGLETMDVDIFGAVGLFWFWRNLATMWLRWKNDGKTLG